MDFPPIVESLDLLVEGVDADVIPHAVVTLSDHVFCSKARHDDLLKQGEC